MGRPVARRAGTGVAATEAGGSRTAVEPGSDRSGPAAPLPGRSAHGGRHGAARGSRRRRPVRRARRGAGQRYGLPPEAAERRQGAAVFTAAGRLRDQDAGLALEFVVLRGTARRVVAPGRVRAGHRAGPGQRAEQRVPPDVSSARAPDASVAGAPGAGGSYHGGGRRFRIFWRRRGDMVHSRDRAFDGADDHAAHGRHATGLPGQGSHRSRLVSRRHSPDVPQERGRRSLVCCRSHGRRRPPDPRAKGNAPPQPCLVIRRPVDLLRPRVGAN